MPTPIYHEEGDPTEMETGPDHERTEDNVHENGAFGTLTISILRKT